MKKFQKPATPLWIDNANRSIDELFKSIDYLSIQDAHFDLFIDITNGIYHYFGIPTDDVVDIDRSIHMSHIVFKYFKYLALLKHCPDEKIIRRNGVFMCQVSFGSNSEAITLTDLDSALRSTSGDFLPVINFHVMLPIISVCTLFGPALEELKFDLFELPPNLLPRRKSTNTTEHVEEDVVETSISVMGLWGRHMGLMFGATFSLERKFGMLNVLGPMTLAAMLRAGTVNAAKVKNAFEESMPHLPMADYIADALISNEDKELLELIEILADILSVTSHKNYKMFLFPLDFYRKGKEIFTARPGMAGKFSFNGINITKAYVESNVHLHWRIKCNPNHKEDMEQLIFHAIFDAGLTSLDILSQITNREGWKQKAELLHALKNRETYKPQRITPIDFNYISGAPSRLPMQCGEPKPKFAKYILFEDCLNLNILNNSLGYFEPKKQLVCYSNEVSSLLNALNIIWDELSKDLYDFSSETILGSEYKWFRVIKTGNSIKFVEENPSKFAREE